MVPTEALNAPTYIYLSYVMLTITNLTYIWEKFVLTADGSNKMSHSAEFNETR